MGIRISRAIGYGMPWRLFQNLCLIKSDDLAEDLYDKFSATNELIVPESRVYNGRSLILDQNILATKFRGGENGVATNLYQLVMTPDDITDIMFFPNLEYAKRWHRRDDDIDYAFHNCEDDPSANIKTFYKNLGFYPFNSNFMDETGKPVHKQFGANSPKIAPDIPSEIRYYLTILEILSEDGINQLRPLVAEYWC